MIQGKKIKVDQKYINVEIQDGRIISTPLIWYDQLKEASPEQLQNFEMIGHGTMIEWEELDVHIDIEEMFKIDQEAAA